MILRVSNLALKFPRCRERAFLCRRVAQVGERYLDAVEVSGSIPLAPTIFLFIRAL